MILNLCDVTHLLAVVVGAVADHSGGSRCTGRHSRTVLLNDIISQLGRWIENLLFEPWRRRQLFAMRQRCIRHRAGCEHFRVGQ